METTFEPSSRKFAWIAVSTKGILNALWAIIQQGSVEMNVTSANVSKIRIDLLIPAC